MDGQKRKTWIPANNRENDNHGVVGSFIMSTNEVIEGVGRISEA